MLYGLVWRYQLFSEYLQTNQIKRRLAADNSVQESITVFYNRNANVILKM
jgi:hypothetical protein